MSNNLAALVPSALASLQMVSVEEAMGALGIKRTFFYGLVGQGRITPVKLGRRTLVKVSDLQAFIAALPTAGGVQ